jgi:putative DNA primase/helicase
MSAKIDFDMGLNVIPLEQGKKTPAVDWKNFQTRHLSQEEFNEWFGQDPNRNHAVIGGVTSHNLVVLDFEAWNDFVAFFPEWERLAKTTRVVKTHHGGAHVYYYTQEEVQRRIKVFGDKHQVDVCGWGGYVCGIGTVIDHALCDKKKCHIDSGKSTYEAVGTMDISVVGKGLLASFLDRGRRLGWQVEVLKDTRPERDTFDHLLTVDGRLNGLFNGDIEGYASRSEAEFALVIRLISYGFSDEQINRIMKDSRIGKWNESEQYAEYTLRKAHEWIVRDRSVTADESPSLLGLGNPSDAADHVLERFHIITTDDGLYVYDEGLGMYRQGMEKAIQAWAEQQARVSGGNISLRYIAEMFGHIQRRTYERDIADNTDVFHLKNGILNMKTGEFIDHTPDKAYFSAIQLPVKYDPKAKCPLILKFISEIVYPEDIAVIQEFTGYMFYRGYPVAAALLLVGGGSNGKSTLISLIKALLGPSNIATCSLQELEYNHFAKADLVGKLANLFADLSDVALKSTGVFKMLTGGDPITAERKYGQRSPFVNYAKLVFSANKVPMAYDDSDAFFRRFIIVKFPMTFNKRTADARLLEKLTTEEELSGLLNWGLEGLRRLMDNGFVFSNSKSVEEIKDEYIRMSNPVEAFFMDMVEEDPEKRIAKADLYQAYVSYCKARKLAPVTMPTFFLNVKKNGRNYSETRLTSEENGRKVRYSAFLGIALKSSGSGERPLDATPVVQPAKDTEPEAAKPEARSEARSEAKPEAKLEAKPADERAAEAPDTGPAKTDSAPGFDAVNDVAAGVQIYRCRECGALVKKEYMSDHLKQH